MNIVVSLPCTANLCGALITFCCFFMQSGKGAEKPINLQAKALRSKDVHCSLRHKVLKGRNIIARGNAPGLRKI